MSSKTLPSYGQGDFKILDTQSCYKGHLSIEKLKLQCRLYEGGWSSVFYREVLRRHRGVGVLLYDPLSDHVLLVEQFRVGCLDDHANGPWALELVAGLVDTDEAPEQVARRETEEEAGLSVEDLLPVVEYYNSPGGSDERITVFCARFDSRREEGIFGLQSESENIRTCILSREQALAKIASGKINNAMCIIALQWLQLNLDAVKTQLKNEKN